ncbi:PfaD family polyunsaturated fatty acid/polyketide biosynthesis protein [Spirosoma sp. KCTC 42546]|uniref:PfaD family polyunsaturated fatty acid/polyketide biosynthesis protein n=1 Tax=Spirosoma sp. KCTC 42546 TaxID=2520506 RepID=UPI00115771DF|nr:PfaD family polyunsaturated fatty acid/polyketide biosynthesis protein [Spirosoma sp. KCTC 42546]QDK77937.1 PfaD family polyunsaturated fatty acid/polyketide biosynthesis protein [Spirosoma sp. KCTC 42546]
MTATFPSIASPKSNGISYRQTPVTAKWFGDPRTVRFDQPGIRQFLETLGETSYWVRDAQGRIGVTMSFGTSDPDQLCSMELLATLPAYQPDQLGDPSFQQAYGTHYAYMAGAMANGIASEELVIALGKAGMLASFGAGGLVPARIEQAIDTIQQALPNGPYAFNLIHSPSEESLERKAVELYLAKGVTVIEASAFLSLTEHVVRYRAAGLQRRSDGTIHAANRVIAKVSRLEVATLFLKPAPASILQKLVAAGSISPEQAQLASMIPMADDITVEADSGGHTDKRSLVCLLPAVLSLRDQIQAEQNDAYPVRIGAAGGLSTPESIAGSFAMGAAYVVTGSINQSCREAGTSDHVRAVLARVSMTDVMMAPAADMFEMGVKLQVAKTGTLFGLRAQKLYELYSAYPGWEAIPEKERATLEKNILGESFDSVWAQCLTFFMERDPEQITLANDNPKRKMALVFRWYLGLSSVWANRGVTGRELDYQIWCGPAMGSFNQWVKGTRLEVWENRRVADVAHQLLHGAAYLNRIQYLSMLGVQLDASYRTVHVQPTSARPSFVS